MLKQLLWIEVLLKGGCGLALYLLPVRGVGLAGLGTGGNGFWPRILGSVLIGIAGALLLQGYVAGGRTIAPAALVTINLAGAGGLVTAQVLGTGAQTRRGSVLAWSLVIVLSLLSLVEISFA